MDLDLSEYEQVEESRLLQVGASDSGAHHQFVVSLSSCSDQASLDESDFIFVPDLKSLKRPPLEEPQVVVAPAATRYAPSPVNKQPTAATAAASNPFQLRPSHSSSCHQQVVPTINRCQAAADQLLLPPARRLETPDKPVGLLRSSPRSPTDPSKLTGLMQQIVTRSDSILIVIPCSYCNQTISCQPSDVSSWLRHMDGQHNSRLCPICAKLIGLGFTRDINIMKRHVLEHIDDRWLSNQPTKTNFTFGLQQQWFSEIGCAVRDLRNK